MINKCQWFSGKIQRCHRWAPGSIPGWRIMNIFYITLLYFISIQPMFRRSELSNTATCVVLAAQTNICVCVLFFLVKDEHRAITLSEIGYLNGIEKCRLTI